jgi:hypothetical protein
MTTKNKEIQKSKMVAIIEKIIRWVFYVELAFICMALWAHLVEGGTYGIELVIIPGFSTLIALLSIFIITKLTYY